MRSAETALGIIHDRGKSAVLEDTGEPGAPKWRMPGSGRVAPCKRVEFSRLGWRPRQSLSQAAAYRVLRGVW